MKPPRPISSSSLTTSVAGSVKHARTSDLKRNDHVSDDVKKEGDVNEEYIAIFVSWGLLQLQSTIKTCFLRYLKST